MSDWACSEGYSKGKIAGSCDDIDECDTNTHVCDDKATCTNTIGSYTCQCPKGYSNERSNGKIEGSACHDIDECDTNTDDCDNKANCTNNIGSYTCQCPKGYYNGRRQFGKIGGSYCQDKNECQMGNRCSAGTCRNTMGSYDCDCKSHCRPADNKKCKNNIGGFVCVCIDGYSMISGQCVDIDECLDYYKHNCFDKKEQIPSSMLVDPKTYWLIRKQPHILIKYQPSTCENTDGSYVCLCEKDFRQEIYPKPISIRYQKNYTSFRYRKWRDDWSMCVDENACRNSTCDKDSENCVNNKTYGRIECKCKNGYIRDKSTSICLDLDECINESHNCEQNNSTCINTQGSFDCSCEMYPRTVPKLIEKKWICVDDNECISQTHICNGEFEKCVNLIEYPGFKCIATTSTITTSTSNTTTAVIDVATSTAKYVTAYDTSSNSSLSPSASSMIWGFWLAGWWLKL